MKMVVNNAIQASTKAEGEEILKNHGLRGIMVGCIYQQKSYLCIWFYRMLSGL
jgi:hypothetical protein